MSVNANSELGNSYIGNRLCEKTKKSYANKRKTFHEWVKRKFPDLVNPDGEVLYERLNEDVRNLSQLMCPKNSVNTSSV
jgi:hypothetical protein